MRARATAELAFLHPRTHPSNHSFVQPLSSVEPPQKGLVVLCSRAFPVQSETQPSHWVAVHIVLLFLFVSIPVHLRLYCRAGSVSFTFTSTPLHSAAQPFSS